MGKADLSSLGRLAARDDFIRFGNRSDSGGSVNTLAAIPAADGDRLGCVDADANRWREPW